jgi:SpoVK/Ycf46/Vps4 family AAA+-type ATPase
MMGRKEREASLYYLNNLMGRPMPAETERRLFSVLDDYSMDIFGMEVEDSYARRNNENGRPKIQRSIKAVREVLKRQKIADIAAAGYDKVLDTIFNVFNIAAEDRGILLYLAYAVTVSFIDHLNDRLIQHKRLLANITGVAPAVLQRSLSVGGRLSGKGILRLDSNGNCPRLSSPFLRALNDLSPRGLTEEKVRKFMVGPAARAALRRGNFLYLAEEYDHARALLADALRERRAGVNILLYGIPGTGKTELSKSIARDAGAKLYMMSEEADNDKSERLSELLFAQSLLENDGCAVILFDEAEDVFTHSPFVRNDNSKLFFNRMLERNKTPVIWITNDTDSMDPAYIRRFKYAIKVGKPDKSAKEAIWRKICAKRRLKLPDEKIAGFARAYDVAPSIIDAAVESAAITGSEDAIERTVEALHEAAFGGDGRDKEEGKNGSAAGFMPELLSADTDLKGLADKLAGKGGTRFSLCLYGESGTGKSAFARHLAERLGMDVIHKRASDIVSCWVGGTERNIADAFRKARKEKAMLIFDEADSFLRDRKTAEHSWEASQVNEMLTWMEEHPYPFVCTTNLMRDIDPASLRRFTFKVRYNYMKAAQIVLAFKHFFGIGIDAAPAGLTHLTPGDFAVVKAKRDVLGIADAAGLITMLEDEQSAKGIKSTKMGFA